MIEMSKIEPDKTKAKPIVPMDYVMWIGGNNYSTESFIKEGQILGVCRRVRLVPKNMIKGVSRVFLISDMTEADRVAYKIENAKRDRARHHMGKALILRKAAELGWIESANIDLKRKKVNELGDALRAMGWNEVPSIKNKMPRGKPVVIGYFLVRGMPLVILPGVDVADELKKRGLDAYEYQAGGFGFNDERACGSLVLGGTYLLSEEDMDKVKDLAKSGRAEGQIITFNKVIPYKLKRSRAMRSIPQSVGERLIQTGVV